MKVTYTADDGTVFESERACLEHEGWSTDAFQSWEASVAIRGGMQDYGCDWPEKYGQWLAEDPDMTPTRVAWDAIHDTLGLRGAWICREGLIEIGKLLKEAS